MSQGRERLEQGLNARDACAIGTIVFTTFAILLGFLWRRSVLQALKQIRGR